MLFQRYCHSLLMIWSPYWSSSRVASAPRRLMMAWGLSRVGFCFNRARSTSGVVSTSSMGSKV